MKSDDLGMVIGSDPPALNVLSKAKSANKLAKVGLIFLVWIDKEFFKTYFDTKIDKNPHLFQRAIVFL